MKLFIIDDVTIPKVRLIFEVLKSFLFAQFPNIISCLCISPVLPLAFVCIDFTFPPFEASLATAAEVVNFIDTRPIV